MSQPRFTSIILVPLLGLVPVAAIAQATPNPPGAAQEPATQSGASMPTRLEADVLQALAANPATAPYPFATAIRGGKLVLRGRVGTKQIHDIAIRTAMAFTPAIDDQLVIDTAETTRVLAGPPLAAPPAAPTTATAPVGGFGYAYPGAGMGMGFGGGAPYVYPQPLFGWYDEPFYGFEPPVISYPPWWGAMSARRLSEYALATPPSSIPPVPVPQPPTSSAAQNTIEMAIDPQGVAILRGNVPRLEDRIAIGQKIANTPGVNQVINLLNVQNPEEDAGAIPPEGNPAPQPNAPEPQKAVPPPPEPMPPLPRNVQTLGPETRPASTGLAGRIEESLRRRPALADSTIQVKASDGVATLTGRLPSAYEAMLAYRAAEQTPGVREIDDRLEFPAPDGQSTNPLLKNGRPQDVEPYLKSQIQRQLGDQAHVDRVTLQGDRLEVRGTLAEAQSRNRVEAVLRSMSLLRGFQLAPDFQTDF